MGTRRKQNKTVKKKNTSNKTIHQIFYNIGRGELKDIPAFNKCYQHNKKYCKKTVSLRMYSMKRKPKY